MQLLLTPTGVSRPAPIILLILPALPVHLCRLQLCVREKAFREGMSASCVSGMRPVERIERHQHAPWIAALHCCGLEKVVTQLE